ncbi:MAG: sulfotransferase [Gemmatimonadetes bacterium]|nr:sulfotransferase [Gemmatimonadota bacterium]
MSRPGFLVIGAQRAGTTWMDRQLRSHPQVYLPQRRKEVHYFDRYYARGPEWYAGFFPSSDAGATSPYRAIGEITPRYLYDPEVPDRIARDLPDAKLIAVLRHPVDRAYSQYSLEIRDEGEVRTFEQFLAARPDALDRGRYAAQLARYFELFPRENIEVFLFERVMADPAAALDRMAALLDLDPEPFRQAPTSERVNGAYRPRYRKLYAAAHRVGDFLHENDLDWFVNVAKSLGVPRWFGNSGRLPKLDAATRARWAETFTEDIAALEEMLGETLPEWSAPDSVNA